MRTQQVVIKFLIIAALAVAFIVSSFFFIRWLYWDNSSETAAAAFTDYQQDAGNTSKYSGNLYINIINTTIPAAKVSYESRYGQKLPGFAASTYSKLFNGMNFDIKDPKTYFSFVFTAFSQYDENGSLATAEPDEEISKLPVITSFDEAPEGAIYFSEEEEYNAEQAANSNGVPSSETLEGEEIAEVPDPARLEIEKKQPSVLLLHTHSTESYTPFIQNNYHSLNDKENMIQVGKVMTDVLESKYKYNVIHDVTKHDRYSYADSYINSQKTIVSQLEKNKSVKVVLDVHRDAMAARDDKDMAAKKAEYTAKINGKSAAKVMLVIGGGNKNYTELRKFAVYIQKKMDKLYPGLFYKIVTKPGKKYNQYYRDHSMLIEVGCTFNTDEEAKYSAELMGNVMGEVIKDLGN